MLDVFLLIGSGSAPLQRKVPIAHHAKLLERLSRVTRLVVSARDPRILIVSSDGRAGSMLIGVDLGDTSAHDAFAAPGPESSKSARSVEEKCDFGGGASESAEKSRLQVLRCGCRFRN